MAYPLATSDPLMYAGIGLQTVKGTAVAPTVFVPYRSAPALSHGMSGEDVYEGGTGPYKNRVQKMAHDPAGTLAMGSRPNTAAKLLAYFLGADSIAGTGPYTHTLTPNPTTRRYLTVEQGAGASGDIIERFVGAVLKGCTISFEGNADLMHSFNWIALDTLWQATAATPTYESGLHRTTPGANFKGADGTFTIDGAAEVNVKSMEISLEWNYDEDIRLADVTREDFLKLELTGTVKLVQLLNDADTALAYRRINYGADAGTSPAAEYVGNGALVALFDNGLTTTNERELQYTVPAINWTMAKYTDLDPAGATMYVEREGTIVKGTNPFVTIAAKTSDTPAYVT